MTPDPSEYNKPLNIHINSIPIPTTSNPTILGLTFDPKLKYTTHTDNTITKAKKNTQSPKTPHINTLGKKQRNTHHHIQNITPSHHRIRQHHLVTHHLPQQTPKKIKNAALRTITGCTLDTNTQHLLSETKILPLQNHLKLHASQLTQKASHPTHPLHPLTTQEAHPRYKKQSTFNNNINYTLNIPSSTQTTSHTNKKQHENHTHKNSTRLHIIHSQQNSQQATPTHS